jgi:hypothetical protein
VWGKILSFDEGPRDFYIEGCKANLISVLIGFTVIPTLQQEDEVVSGEVHQRFILQKP